MDALLESIGKLLGVFKDPVNVILLLLCLAEGWVIYRFGRFMMERYDKDIESRLKSAESFDGLTKAIEGLSDRCRAINEGINGKR